MLKIFVLLAAVLAIVSSVPVKPKATPSCKSCHPVDPNKINVHLIPHSHDDVGWLKTVDQYFYGHRSNIQWAGVQYIISSTVEALKQNKDRRFIQVETAFFWKWWQRQTDEIRQDFVDLVNNGQIEIVNAAWSMNDEAAVNYQSTIDQFTWGLRTISETVGECGIPRVGWQIDPFGHSREQASIFARLGYDGVFFARIDYDDKNQKIADKNMEVIWRGSESLNNTDIFTNMFPEFYFPPGGYCFDITCGDELLVDDERSEDYNIPRKVDDFGNHMQNLAAYYKTNNLLIPMGGDFQYQAAERNFINTDKLVKAFENHDTINVIYSTPSCYIEAVNEAANQNGVEFTLKTDDFFPYGSSPHDYWTGYFTSRPNAKGAERVSNNILQAAKQLAAFSIAKGTDDVQNDLRFLREAVGILQHHDAITGTAKEEVAKDYARLLYLGVKKVEPALSTVVTNLLKKDGSPDTSLNLETCLLANTSICEPTRNGRFLVSLYNPLSRVANEIVRIPVPEGSYRVTGADGAVEELIDVVDSISSFSYVKDIPETVQPKELVFNALVPAMGLALYYVEKTGDKSPKYDKVKDAKKVKFGNDEVGFEIDEDTGLLNSVTMKGVTLQISQEFRYYNGYDGDNNGDGNRASGAYIFRPKEQDSLPVFQDRVEYTAITGNLVDEVHQIFNEWITQVIRVYKVPGVTSNWIEFDWLVGPIDVDSAKLIGKEVISKFTVQDFDNEQTFYTDSNGRELIKRVLNKRYDYEYDSTNEPVASNYYPVTSKISIKDQSQLLQVSVLNDRAQGGASLDNGEIELMVHRRLLRDDVKGVDEALDDIEFDQGVVARGRHYLVIGSAANNSDHGISTNAEERILALKKLLPPVALLTDASSDDLSLENVQNSYEFQWEGLTTRPLNNLNILTLEPWVDDSLLLRVEHIIAQNEDNDYSVTESVDVANLFTLFDVSTIQETTLGGNELFDVYNNNEKYSWNLNNGQVSKYNKAQKVADPSPTEIAVDPMQIRTFVITTATP